MDANRLSELEAWARAGVDALGHATEHMSTAADADRRIALLSIDQGIEALITSYLRRGPGSTDASQQAETARRIQANFRMKRDYVLVVAVRNGIETPTGDEFSLVRSLRNNIQHSGDWVVPTADDVAVAFEIARATLRAFQVGEPAMAALPAAAPVSGGHRVENLPVAPKGEEGALVLSGRSLAEVAWEISTEIDPNQEGIHARVLGERLASRRIYGRSQTSVRDALNHAHDLFEAHGRAVWSWMPRTIDITDGLAGPELAETVFGVMATHDPDAEGMHAGRDILPILTALGMTVRGQDKPATIRAALNADGRFETVPTTWNKPGERLRIGYRLKR